MDGLEALIVAVVHGFLVCLAAATIAGAVNGHTNAMVTQECVATCGGAPECIKACRVAREVKPVEGDK